MNAGVKCAGSAPGPRALRGPNYVAVGPGVIFQLLRCVVPPQRTPCSSRPLRRCLPVPGRLPGRLAWWRPDSLPFPRNVRIQCCAPGDA